MTIGSIYSLSIGIPMQQAICYQSAITFISQALAFALTLAAAFLPLFSINRIWLKGKTLKEAILTTIRGHLFWPVVCAICACLLPGLK
ncbi:MAG: hypothetical protein IPP97_17640 [Candidatus Obscuribacter sp.]|nr:hypothetical protein [Candidatus Obscuribacter sp.]MBP7578445.1 hypothetical protein [Candidatus Obscuribacter sp.]